MDRGNRPPLRRDRDLMPRRSTSGRNIPKAPDRGPPAEVRACVTRRVFQPMWGIFKPGRAVKRTTRPSSRPSPTWSPSSVLLSNKSWRPRQTPRHGLPCLTASQNASPRPVFRNSAMASANAPTPGRMTFEAARTRSGSDVISAAPTDRLDGFLNAAEVAHSKIDDHDHAPGLTAGFPYSGVREEAGEIGPIERRIVVPWPGLLSIAIDP